MPVNHPHSIRSALKVSALTFLACVVLTGCSGRSASSVNPANWLTPYRVDVIQGNFISREQVALLKAGMTRAQVKEVLGTPLLASVFHADRWDYVFTLNRQNVAPQSFKYTVFFKGDQVERFEGDNMPSDAEFISTLANGRKLGKVPVLEATEAQLKALDKSTATRSEPNLATAPAAAGVPAESQPVAYPPLESPAR